jgi:hypothetical protein
MAGMKDGAYKQAKELMQNRERLSKELGDKNSLGKPEQVSIHVSGNENHYWPDKIQEVLDRL